MELNIEKLMRMQEKLDARIFKKTGNTKEMIWEFHLQAFLTELGELGNEWRGFKHWSEDQKPRIDVLVPAKGPEIKLEKRNLLLEEYIDGLHFLLSIGLMVEYSPYELEFKVKFPTIKADDYSNKEITIKFLRIYECGTMMRYDDHYLSLFQYYLDLGAMLGFTWDQIQEAYIQKNKVNHERQDQGY